MIKYQDDGYYFYEPSPFYGRNGKIIQFYCGALIFFNNGKVKSLFKYEFDKKDSSFNKSDAKEIDYFTYSFTMENNTLILTEKMTNDLISIFEYKRISDELFISKETGDTIKFKKW